MTPIEFPKKNQRSAKARNRKTYRKFEEKNIMKNLIAILLFLIPVLCLADDFNGYWKGNYLLQGTGWPLRLEIKQSADSIQVYMDIPNLVLAQEPLSATINKDTLEVTFLLGLGTIQFVKKEDILVPLNKSQSPFLSRTKAPPYQIEEVAWQSGQEILKGALYLPDSNDKHPLLIRLHGSDNGSRKNWEYRSWADFFARKGIATVVFDRRGEGESSISSGNDGFNALATDVVNLIAEMKKRKDIDTDKIILNGGSQAAYIAFLVNTMISDIDYMLLSGASSVSLIEQEQQSLIFRMRANGETQASIDAAVGYQHLYFHYVMTGENWKILQESAINAQRESWAKYTDQPQEESHLNWWRKNYNAYQPQELLPLVRVPILILYGENDVITPPSVMISHFVDYFKKENMDAYKIVVCPKTGHSLEVEFAYDRWGNPIFPQRSPELFTEIEKWLAKYNLCE